MPACLQAPYRRSLPPAVLSQLTSQSASTKWSPAAHPAHLKELVPPPDESDHPCLFYFPCRVLQGVLLGERFATPEAAQGLADNTSFVEALLLVAVELVQIILHRLPCLGNVGRGPSFR